MPGAGLAKLKLRVCQPLAVVTVASVSTDLLASAAFSAFRRTGTPAAGDQTRTVMVLLLALKPIGATAALGSVDTVVPAQSSAVALFSTRATLLLPPAGSATMLASSAPPKPVRVGAGASSMLIVVLPAPPPAAVQLGVKLLPSKARLSSK